MFEKQQLFVKPLLVAPEALLFSLALLALFIVVCYIVWEAGK